MMREWIGPLSPSPFAPLHIDKGKDLQVTKPKISSSFAANEIQSEQIFRIRIVNASFRSGHAPYGPLKGSTPWRANNNVGTVYLCLCSQLWNTTSAVAAKRFLILELPQHTEPRPPSLPYHTQLSTEPGYALGKQNYARGGGGRRRCGWENSSECAKETPKVIVNSIKVEGAKARGKEGRQKEEGGTPPTGPLKRYVFCAPK